MEEYELFASEEEIFKDVPHWREESKKSFLDELKKMPPEKQKEFWHRCHEHWIEYR